MGYIGDRVTVQWYADNRHYTGTVTGQPSVGQYMVQFDSHDIPRDYFGAPVYQHRFGPRVYGTSVVRVIDDLQSLERKKNGARHRLNDLQRQVRHLQNRAQEEKNRIARLDMRIAEVKEVLPDHLKLAILSFALYRHEVEDFCSRREENFLKKVAENHIDSFNPLRVVVSGAGNARADGTYIRQPGSWRTSTHIWFLNTNNGSQIFYRPDHRWYVEVGEQVEVSSDSEDAPPRPLTLFGSQQLYRGPPARYSNTGFAEDGWSCVRPERIDGTPVPGGEPIAAPCPTIQIL